MAGYEHQDQEPEAMSVADDAFASVLADIEQGPSVQVLRTDQADELALRLIDATGGTLVDDLEDIDDLVVDDGAGLGATSGPPGSTVVCPVGELTGLAGRVIGARSLVAAAVASTADRAYPSTGVALHPDSIRSAAAEVLEARADVFEAERAAGVVPDDDEEDDVAVDPTIDLDAHPEESESFDRFWGAGGAAPTQEEDAGPAPDAGEAEDVDDGWSLRRPIILLVIWLVLGGAVFAAGGGPVALALPAIALVWIAYLVWRRRRSEAESESSAHDAEAEHDVAANLASVLATTDRAYGGEGARFDDPEMGASARALASARQRLKVAENRWRALMGPDADVHDVEAEIARRDPQHGSLPAAVVDESPSVRAARHHLRRLEGQWKVAWWALDRTPPPVDEADGPVALLRSEGRTEVVFETGVPRAVTTVVYRAPDEVFDETALPTAAGIRLLVVVAAGAADQVS